jgi:hypothetical protein
MSRLRPRNSKVNYNINNMLKTPKKQENEEKDVEI